MNESIQKLEAIYNWEMEKKKELPEWTRGVVDPKKELQNTEIAFNTPKRWQSTENLGENI